MRNQTNTQLLADYWESSGECRKREIQTSAVQSGPAACEVSTINLSILKADLLQMFESV